MQRCAKTCTKCVRETFSPRLTFPTIPRGDPDSALPDKWPLTVRQLPTLRSKPSPATPKVSSSVWSHTRQTKQPGNEHPLGTVRNYTVKSTKNRLGLFSFSCWHLIVQIPCNHHFKLRLLSLALPELPNSSCLPISIPCFAISRYLSSTIVFSLSPTGGAFFVHPPPFATLQFSPWSLAGLENSLHAIADASIFGHADGTEGWGSHTILPFLPPSHPSIPSSSLASFVPSF